MYFWRISELKQDLAASPLSSRQALSYLIALGALTTIACALPTESLNVWDHVDSGVTVVAFVLGTLYFYQCNGGAAGTDFLGRYMALNWVFGLRFFAAVFVLMFAAFLSIAVFLPEDPFKGSTPVGSAIWAVVELVFYYRLGQHVQAVQSRVGPEALS